MTPPPPGARVIIWSSVRTTVNKGSARNTKMTADFIKSEHRGTVVEVDECKVYLDTGESIRLWDVAAWRELP